MKRKLLSLLLGTAMVSSLLAGCGNTAEETPSTQETPAPVTEENNVAQTENKGRVYYLNFKPEVDEAWQEIAKAYTNATGVEVKVVTAASGTYEEVLRTEIAQNEPVTLFQVNGPIGYRNWKDYCMDLTDTDLYNALTDKSLAITGEDGAVYGVPYTIEGYGIIYNDAIMRAYCATEGAVVASAEEIHNFDTLKAVVEDMTAKKEELGIEGVFASTSLLPGEDWRWQTHLANLPIYYEFRDKEVTDAEAVELTYSENFKNIFDLYIQNSTVAPGLLGSKSVSDSMAEFALGQCAFVQNGNWAWSQIAEVEGNVVAAEDVKFLPIYTGMEGEENQGLCIGTENYWCINEQASETDKKATEDFVSWLIGSQEGKNYMVNALGNVSPFTTFGEDEKPTDPLAQSMLASMESGKISVPWSFSVFPSLTFKDEVGAALLEYCNGNMTWDEVKDTFVTRWAEEKAATVAQ